MLGKRNRQVFAYGTERLMRRYIMICHKPSKAIESTVLFETKEGLMCPKACLLSPTKSADLVKDLYLQILFLTSCSIVRGHVSLSQMSYLSKWNSTAQSPLPYNQH